MNNNNTEQENDMTVKVTIYHPLDKEAPAGWKDGKVGEMRIDYDWNWAYECSYEQTIEADTKVLDKVWEGWNAGSGCECAEFYEAEVRSMMVGDFVKVDREIFRCEKSGWKRTNQAALDAEIYNIK